MIESIIGSVVARFHFDMLKNKLEKKIISKSMRFADFIVFERDLKAKNLCTIDLIRAKPLI